jgi:hypothetical protein
MKATVEPWFLQVRVRVRVVQAHRAGSRYDILRFGRFFASFLSRR